VSERVAVTPDSGHVEGDHRECAVVCSRPLLRHRHMAATDQPPIRDAWCGTRHRRVLTKAARVMGEAHNTTNACGLNSFGKGHRREHNGEEARAARSGHAHSKVTRPVNPPSQISKGRYSQLGRYGSAFMNWAHSVQVRLRFARRHAWAGQESKSTF
jgi:hypothetical protein